MDIKKLKKLSIRELRKLSANTHSKVARMLYQDLIQQKQEKNAQVYKKRKNKVTLTPAQIDAMMYIEAVLRRTKKNEYTISTSCVGERTMKALVKKGKINVREVVMKKGIGYYVSFPTTNKTTYVREFIQTESTYLIEEGVVV